MAAKSYCIFVKHVLGLPDVVDEGLICCFSLNPTWRTAVILEWLNRKTHRGSLDFAEFRRSGALWDPGSGLMTKTATGSRNKPLAVTILYFASGASRLRIEICALNMVQRYIIAN